APGPIQESVAAAVRRLTSTSDFGFRISDFSMRASYCENEIRANARPHPGPSARSAELQLRVIAMRPWRAELELCAPMGDAPVVLRNFHALGRRTAAWGLT